MTERKGPYLSIPRRRFLKGAGAAAIILPFASNRVLAEPTDSPLFTLGVASGDPRANSVVLWTRIAPEPLELDGGNGKGSIVVKWRIATDPSMRNVFCRGDTRAFAENGHNVRVLARDLPADSWLYYQFEAWGVKSAVGRTRTFPRRRSDPGQMRFALTSCQNYEQGFYNAWRDIVETDDVDFVMQCGDYIYEGASNPNALRPHIGPEIVTVEDYRRRYAQYRLDENLRAAHEAYPFIVTWDDHEVDNNYAALIPEDDQTSADFLERRRQAYRAYFEVMPLRNGINRFVPEDDYGHDDDDESRAHAFPSRRRLFRRMDFGRLASINVLDTRQYRDDQPCGDGLQVCPEAAEPNRTMLGARQERWLLRQLHQTRARWRVIEQQVMFMQWDLGVLAGINGFFNVDAWDGYSAQRNRIASELGRLNDSNNIILTGDIHSSWAGELKADFNNLGSQTVGAEFVCAGISSTFGGDDNDTAVRATLPFNQHIRYFNGLQRGYALHSVTNSEWRTDFRLVDDNTVDGSAVRTASSWVVVDSVPGVNSV